MARRKSNAPLSVVLNGRDVGTLTKASSGAIGFRYAPTWLEEKNAIPVSLSLPLREDGYVGEPVIAVFDNLLPDNKPVRESVAARFDAGGTDAFSMLSAIGRDCVGALQFLREGDARGEPGIITGDLVSDDDIAAILNNLKTAPLGMDDDADFRISIAGAQEKTALLRHDGKWLRPHGTTPTTHILKPRMGKVANDIDLSDSVENEYLCMKLCAAFGLATAEVTIENFAGVKALSVKRFDRLWTRDGKLLRLPQEDFCQALGVPPSRKYESDHGPGILKAMNLLTGSDTPTEDRAQFFRAQVLFWLLGATDGHAKNFSVFLYPNARFHMTPIYDVLSVQPTLDAKQLSEKRYKLAMAVGKSRHYHVDEIVPRHFQQTAKQAGFEGRAVTTMLEEIYDTAGARIASVKDALPVDVPEHLVASIVAGIKRRLNAVRLWRQVAAE